MLSFLLLFVDDVFNKADDVSTMWLMHFFVPWCGAGREIGLAIITPPGRANHVHM